MFGNFLNDNSIQRFNGYIVLWFYLVFNDLKRPESYATVGILGITIISSLFLNLYKLFTKKEITFLMIDPSQVCYD